MDKVKLDELKEFNNDPQYLADIARIDQIIAKGTYSQKCD